MRLVIMQPSYLPWLGYFDLLLQSDLFLVYDNVQFDKDGWRNRNRIKTPSGAQWLTVPVLTKGMNRPTNREIRINTADPWRRKHLKSLEMNYRKATYFDEIYPKMEEFLSKSWESLMDLNMEGLKIFCDYLGIQTRIQFASDLQIDLPDDRNDKLVAMCCHLKANEFYEPEGGRGYIDAKKFEENDIRLFFQDFKHPTYPQLHGAFISHLSVIDCLFNCGKKSIDLIKTSLKGTKEGTLS